MNKKVDLTGRSDKLLLSLGFQLSEANIRIYQALSVWQSLVDLETQLKMKKMDRSAPSDTIPEVRSLQIQCNLTACELKELYNAIAERLSSVSDTLAVVINRLDEDYRKVFKCKGL